MKPHNRSAWSTVLGWLALSATPGCMTVDAAPPGDDPPDAGAPTSVIDVERYEVVGRYDWATTRLRATATIRGTAAGRMLDLDARVTSIAAVQGTGTALPFTYDPDAGRLQIDLGPRADAAFEISVQYEAASGPTYGIDSDVDGLTPVTARAGDPVMGRVAYSYAEPEGTRSWLPCHDVPDDRASLAIDLEVDADETVVANGTRVADLATTDGKHRVRYETSFTLPTYLMAFAAGELVAEPTAKAGSGATPITIWHRRGLIGDWASVQAMLGTTLARYEQLIGVPYPFERYDLVLLPDFPGGEEHASATFQDELSVGTQLDPDLDLTAHELSHQWFGDLATVATWDDLWIKEGMAVLLGAEITRSVHDEAHAGTLRGDTLTPAAGDAARDPKLAPAAKFTSGPYDRAAWLYTQVRHIVGESVFWPTLGGLLDAHRQGTLATADVIEAFRPALGPTADRWRAALDGAALPALHVAAAGSDGVTLELADPDGAILDPIVLVWQAADGSRTSIQLAPGVAVTTRPPSADALLIVDPDDVHPAFEVLFASDDDAMLFADRIGDRRAPTTAAQLTALLALPGVHQTAVVSDVGLPDPVTPASFAAFLRDLDDEDARALAVRAACTVAAAPEAARASLPRRAPTRAAHAAAARPETARASLPRRAPARAAHAAAADPAWVTTLTPILRGQPFYAGLDAVDDYAPCSAVANPRTLFKADYATLARNDPAQPVARVDYVARFDLADADALATWSAALAQSPVSRIRLIAASALARQATTIAPASAAAWRAKLATLVRGTSAPDVLSMLLPALVATAGPAAADNAAGLAALSAVLHDLAAHNAHADAACAAHALTGGDDAAWTTFKAGLSDAQATPAAQARLADPSAC